MGLRYAVITPARDEAGNLPRLAACLAAQSQRPETWVIVENGSSDGTPEVAHRLAREYDWVRVLSLPGSRTPVRGAPIVRALHAGFSALDPSPDVAVSVDADITVDPDYFERLIGAFGADPLLGIASGEWWEYDGDRWTQRHVTGNSVIGATRAYRWACLQDVLPLEERLGWDGIDECAAQARGWRTSIVPGLRLFHHRPLGSRDGPGHRGWIDAGNTAWYLGYRPWYLILRATFQARRAPGALAMLGGYAAAAARREPRHPDPAVRAYVRGQQRPGALRARALEAVGRR